jgi:hypothetical protein
VLFNKEPQEDKKEKDQHPITSTDKEKQEENNYSQDHTDKNNKIIGKITIHFFENVTVYNTNDKNVESEFFINVLFGNFSKKTKRISNINELKFDEGFLFIIIFTLFYSFFILF